MRCWASSPARGNPWDEMAVGDEEVSLSEAITSQNGRHDFRAAASRLCPCGIIAGKRMLMPRDAEGMRVARNSTER
jgi:hypothetical protein